MMFSLFNSARLLLHVSVLVSALFSTTSLFAQSSQDLDMLAAAKAGNGDNARLLLDGVNDINVEEADGTTALHYAVLNNDLDLAEALLRSGAEVNARTRYGITPIYLAARNGSAAMTQTLLDAGARANELFNEGETVLMTAARTGDVDTVRVLLDAGEQ